MIRKIEFENFMSLRHTTIELEPLTVFVGPNGAGKSAIFKGLVTLGKLFAGAPVRGNSGEFFFEAGVHLDDIVWGGNSSLPIRFRFWLDDSEEPSYALELKKGLGGWSVTHEQIRVDGTRIEVSDSLPFVFSTEDGRQVELRTPLRSTLRYLVYRYLNDQVALPTIQPIFKIADEFGKAFRYRPSASDIAAFVQHPGRTAQKVRENGSGMAAELQGLQGSDRETFEKIEQSVCQLFPHVQRIGFKTDWQGVRLSFVTTRSEDPIPAPQEADGVLLSTFLFWRLCTISGPTCVCLEEPENGLHPFLLADRFRALKHFSYCEPSSGLQLLIATHSPEFLRAIRSHPSTLYKQLRIVSFTPSQGTQVRRLTHYREATQLIDQYLNDLQDNWRNIVGLWEELTVEA